jgi:hypothetical protein
LFKLSSSGELSSLWAVSTHWARSSGVEVARADTFETMTVIQIKMNPHPKAEGFRRISLLLWDERVPQLVSRLRRDFVKTSADDTTEALNAKVY